MNYQVSEICSETVAMYFKMENGMEWNEWNEKWNFNGKAEIIMKVKYFFFILFFFRIIIVY